MIQKNVKTNYSSILSKEVPYETTFALLLCLCIAAAITGGARASTAAFLPASLSAILASAQHPFSATPALSL